MYDDSFDRGVQPNLDTAIRNKLTERSDDGLRLMPDGRPLQIIVETAGENTEEVDVLELIHDSWRRIGVTENPSVSLRGD